MNETRMPQPIATVTYREPAVVAGRVRSVRVRPWGDTPVPVYLWHGENDRIIPSMHGRYVAERFGHCQVRYYPNEGHAAVAVNHFGEIVESLIH